jgi:hypothetical protein
MVGILVLSILAAVANTILLKVTGDKGKQVSSGSSTSGEAPPMDGAARRELQETGLGRLWWRRRS